MHRKHGSAPALDAGAYKEVFDSVPHAVVMVDDAGDVVDHNRAAQEPFGPLLDRPALRCCDLVGCRRGGDRRLAHRCITATVAEHARPLDGLDLVIQGRGVELVAAPLSDGAGLDVVRTLGELSR
jgi:PAS domain-containing protein